VKRLIGRPQESAQSERKSTTRYGDKPWKRQYRYKKGTLNIQRIFSISLLSSILVFQLTLPDLNEHINPDIDEIIDEVVYLFSLSLNNPRES